MRYRADITAGSLKVKESRIIADLLLQGAGDSEWREALGRRNVLQAKNPATVARLTRLIRARLETMQPSLWLMVRDGSSIIAAQAVLASAIKHSFLLGDFLDLVVRDQYRLFRKTLSSKLWDEFLEACRQRDPEMPAWNESTRRRLRSSVFQMLAQGGYIENTRSLALQRVNLSEEILRYLRENKEDYVLRCITVGT